MEWFYFELILQPMDLGRLGENTRWDFPNWSSHIYKQLMLNTESISKIKTNELNLTDSCYTNRSVFS